MTTKKTPLAFKPTKPEQRVLDCVAQGEPANFIPDDPKSKKETDPAHGDTWGKDRTIRAEFLNRLFLERPDDWTIHPHGLEIEGALITGNVGLVFAQIPAPIQFVKCRFDSPSTLDNATLPILMFRGCHLPGLSVQRATIKGNVFLDQGFTASGEVNFSGATIDGQLICTDGTFNNSDGCALNAQSAAIKGGVFLHDGFIATGMVDFNSATIDGQLNCENGTFNNPNGDALNVYSATIDGGVLLTDGFTATGMVDFKGAIIGGQLNCKNGSFHNPERHALNAQGATIKGSVFLDSSFTATGTVDFIGAIIGGQLACMGGTFLNKQGITLNLSNATVKLVFFGSHRKRRKVSLISPTPM